MVGCTYFYSLEPRPVPPLLVQTEEWGLSTLLWAAEHKASGVESYQAPRQRALKSPGGEGKVWAVPPGPGRPPA